MTVAELRAALSALPVDADTWTVVLSRDSEGNGFSPLHHAEPGRAVLSFPTQQRAEFASAEEMDGDPYISSMPSNALCLWPVR